MNIPENFNILFEDDDLIAIDKPPGILVHPTRISEDTITILPLLRDQIGRRVYPVHRLDRGTSGVLVFGKNRAAAASLSALFRSRQVEKQYQAVIRGYVAEKGQIDYPLAKADGMQPQEAKTDYVRLSQTEVDFSVGKYPRSRYSLVDIYPLTGKFHQIRRHFSHIRHPIIGDKRHGDCKHNKYFRESLGIHRMLLHASELSFPYPNQDEYLVLKAPLDDVFKKAIIFLQL
jgi:tRNA pseudouridine65 synthase